MDYTHDELASGRKFRTLNLMDGYTREALRIEPDTSLPGLRVVRDRKSTRLNSSHLVISVVAVSLDRKSTRLNSSHLVISYAVFCLKKKSQMEWDWGASWQCRQWQSAVATQLLASGACCIQSSLRS